MDWFGKLLSMKNFLQHDHKIPSQYELSLKHEHKVPSEYELKIVVDKSGTLSILLAGILVVVIIDRIFARYSSKKKSTVASIDGLVIKVNEVKNSVSLNGVSIHYHFTGKQTSAGLSSILQDFGSPFVCTRQGGFLGRERQGGLLGRQRQNL